MKRRLPPFSLAILPLLAGCANRDLAARLDHIEAKQDSILAILATVPRRPPVDTSFKDIPAGTSPAEGAEKPLLTVVEFSDLQCPFCAQAQPVLDSLVAAHPGEVRLVFKQFPLPMHLQARPAALAALAAAQQGAFFPFCAKVFPRHAALSDTVYLGAAKELGLDLERFRRDLQPTPEAQKRLEEDIALGRKIGVQGTPTVFVNGKRALERSYDYYEGKLREAKAKERADRQGQGDRAGIRG